jgi:hypothetical protein
VQDSKIKTKKERRYERSRSCYNKVADGNEEARKWALWG